jgi:para-aminobenzoate synthetase component 1
MLNLFQHLQEALKQVQVDAVLSIRERYVWTPSAPPGYNVTAMPHLEFQCAPSVPRLLANLAGRPGRFVLENVPAGTAIIGADPRFVLTARNGIAYLEHGSRTEQIGGGPFGALRTVLAEFEANDMPVQLSGSKTSNYATGTSVGASSVSGYSSEFPQHNVGGCDSRRTERSPNDIPPGVPFAGGAVGCFSYDLGRSIEDIQNRAVEDIPTPDYVLGFYDSALCIDSATGVCTAVSRLADDNALGFWRDLALESLTDPAQKPIIAGPIRCGFTKKQYLDAVERVKDYIRSGDVYQVNLAQRFDTAIDCTADRLYAAVRRMNPPTNGCYIELDGPALVCASPESFLTYDPTTRKIATRPIKGTRPRGHTPEEDERLARELAASEKDRAENLMIVDMLRNDLGRVAEYGSVQVTGLWDIEQHPTVHQMVSTIEAALAERHDAVDLIKACFPGGSITGAPKIRAMQIIEELEPFRRGLYTGSAGYIDCRGRIDLNIIIRSFIVHNSRAYFHGGGGIVIDSDPEMEYQETLDKIAGLKAALGGDE